MSFPRYEKYKDSGVQWLGEVPEHWQVAPLKRDIEFITSGARGWAENYSDDGDVFIRIGNLTRNSIRLDLSDTQRVVVPVGAEGARTQVRAGDVLFSITAYLGSVAVVPEGLGTAYVSQHVALVRLKRRLMLPEWVALVASSYVGKTHLETQGYGGTKVQLSLADVTDLPIIVPPLAEQAEIVTFLDDETAKIDALVEEQKRLIELLKVKRQAVISHAVTKGLNPNAAMKDSGVEWLGKVPAHWDVKRIRYILNAIGDVDHFMPASVENGVPYLMTGDLKEFVSDVRLEDCKQVSRNDYLQLSKKIRTSKGDVVMARYATIGTLMYVDVDVDMLVSYSCVTLKTNPSKMSGMYLFLYMKSDPFRSSIENQTNTNTQGNVGIKDLQDLNVVEPPVDEQAAIVTFLLHETAKIDRLTAEANSAIDLLQERRSVLISAAVTGKIDVRSKVKPPEPALA